MHRRRFLGRALGHAGGMLAVPAWAAAPADKPGFAPAPPLAPIRARADRIVEVSVCTRPFRAAGPRIEVERFGRQAVVHHYGHGGSGWSLSWGSARHAVALARSTGEARIAVIGCGAIGLTSAIVAQRAGLRVRIVCRDQPPETRSTAATGVWSPASRVCTTEGATLAFRQQWAAMTRHSFHEYQALLGLPGAPVEWRDGYLLSDVPFDQPVPEEHERGDEPDYPRLGLHVPELRQRNTLLAPHEHPFPVQHAARYTQMVFNIGAYTRLLLDEFFRNGGRIEQREFTSPRQWAALPERTLINATGYGARALLGDDSIVPVRGQTARLMPQPEVDYGITWRGHNLSVVPRRDGILVQAQAAGDFGNADDTPDRAASEAAVARLAVLFGG